jgi:hypothetical protein
VAGIEFLAGGIDMSLDVEPIRRNGFVYVETFFKNLPECLCPDGIADVSWKASRHTNDSNLGVGELS